MIISLHGQTCLFTGVSSGIGLAVLKELARLPQHMVPAKLLLVVRRKDLMSLEEDLKVKTFDCSVSVSGSCTLSSGAKYARKVHTSTQTEFDDFSRTLRRLRDDLRVDITFYIADLSSPNQVLRVARKVRNDTKRLDVLVSNAGIWGSGSTRTLQQDKLEVHFATNFLAMAILVSKLAPLMRSTSPNPRIVVTGSFAGADFLGCQLNVSDWQFEHCSPHWEISYGKGVFRRWFGFTTRIRQCRSYAHSKLLQHVWCSEFCRKINADGNESAIRIFVVDPGLVNTSLHASAQRSFSDALKRVLPSVGSSNYKKSDNTGLKRQDASSSEKFIRLMYELGTNKFKLLRTPCIGAQPLLYCILVLDAPDLRVEDSPSENVGNPLNFSTCIDDECERIYCDWEKIGAPIALFSRSWMFPKMKPVPGVKETCACDRNNLMELVDELIARFEHEEIGGPMERAATKIKQALSYMQCHRL
eukprot:TRINITY_DN26931_c0_g1_i1.p1 TRINITY_DN26931_c0_g1~~TRINITY_DN26931_c0_g1_i1.p1  ORF type:complete len:472 (-),score=31.79 TRINITY_DN26931_c0_g1_i1:449-1864(-)